jgi:hexosaminidase
MAWYKLNDFRLHLNDNPAFRLKSTNSAFSGLAAADGSYTKQEMRQLQDLAKQYAITITPEIDTPAHDRAITKFRPDLALSSNTNFLDLQNAKTIPFMKSLWDQFTPWFDTNQFHIGADEYDSQYADLYRQYVNTFDDYLGKKGKTVRMWGSLTKIGGSVTVHTNITIDVWNTQWQNPVNAVHQGYYVINDYDRLLYLVPKTGYYNDYLDTKTIYEKWEPTIFDLNNSKLNISYGDSHLLGGQFAEWNDNYRHVSIADIYDRVSAAMPTMGEKLWSGTTSTRTYEQFQQIAHVLGDGPGTHLPHNPPKLAWGTAFGRGG